MKFKLNVCINFFVFFVLFSLSLNIIQAINLSTLQKNNYSRVKPGETTEFTILFWNVEDSAFSISLKVIQAPEDMIVIIRPKEFILTSSEDIESSDIEYINTQKGIFKAIPVRILVRAPKELGEYDIIISATAGEPGSGISSFLEKKFRFTVDVVNPSFFETTTTTEGITTTQPKVNESISQRITGMLVAGPLTDFILLIISIIVLAFVIWFIRFRK